MSRQNRNSARSFGAGLLICVFAQALMAQTLSVPAGLPGWAFNIPDKIQPSAVRPEGIVRVNGSGREYEAAKIAGNANPPDWFPEEHGPVRVIPNRPIWPGCPLNT
jgi:hypothetical protein